MRRQRRFLLIICLIVFCTANLAAQNRSDYRFRSCVADSLELHFDTLSIVPGTFTVQGLDASDYRLDYTNAVLRLADSSFLGRPILLKYKVFPMDLSKPAGERRRRDDRRPGDRRQGGYNRDNRGQGGERRQGYGSRPAGQGGYNRGPRPAAPVKEGGNN